MRVVLVILVGCAALWLSSGVAMAQSASVTVVITDAARPEADPTPPAEAASREAEPPPAHVSVEWSEDLTGAEHLPGAEPTGARLPEGRMGAALVLVVGALGAIILAGLRPMRVRSGSRRGG